MLAALLSTFLLLPFPDPSDLDRAIRSRDWGKARSILAADVAAHPDRFLAAYNLACVEALSGRRDESIAALRLSAERGFPFTSTLLRDVDLDPVRSHAAYPSILERVRENNARALEAFRPKAEKARVLLFPPPEGSRPAPLLVAMHPSGGSARSFAPLFLDLARELGAVLAVPEGLNPAGDGFDWGVLEQGELLVEKAVERAKTAHAVDPARVILAGYSNGASTAFAMAMRKPSAYAGVLSIAGAYEERVAPAPAAGPLPRFAILNGALDPEAGSNRRAADVLSSRGGAVHLRIYPGVGHALPPDTKAELREALRFLLDR
jgi:phospholipase/carboxylesterase